MPLNLLLIGNYSADKQRSMLQYEQLVAKAAAGLGWNVQSWHPEVRYGRKKNTLHGPGKLAGYFDKYILAPRDFRRKWAQLSASGQRPDRVHIIDHSNAPYAQYFPGAPVLITCHDLIAVRRAHGEFSHATSPPRITGRWQQSWILRALKTAQWPGFVSQASKDDFINLTGRKEPTDGWPVIHPSPAQQLKEITKEVADTRLKAAGLEIGPPFIYHHGGGTWYKNRETVIKVFLKCRAQLPNLRLVLSGGNLSLRQKELLQANNAMAAVVDCGAVSREVLEALYSTASVFHFPSWCEGFGWPPVEAQACGCPVVASNAGSLAEVLGKSAELFQPDDIEGMSEAAINLISDPLLSQSMVEKGLKNAARFTFEQMQAEYQKWVIAADRPSFSTTS